MRQYGAAAAIFGLVVGRALAGIGAWVADITTQDGDAIVEPGETATIRISVEFNPRPGETDPDTGIPVMGFGASFADFVAQGAWSSGRVGWLMNDDLYASVPPSLDPPTQSVLGLASGQLSTGGFSFDDPMWLIDLYWDPAGNYTPRKAGFRADAQASGKIPDDTLKVYDKYDGSFGGSPVYWQLPPAEFSFQVVPAPGSAIPISIAVMLSKRRRR